MIRPGSAMLFISLGSLGCRFSFRFDTDWDLPRWKNESQLPTGDFLALAGGRLLLQHTNMFHNVNKQTQIFTQRKNKEKKKTISVATMIFIISKYK